MAGLDWVQVDVGFPMSLEAICASRALGMDRRAFLGSIVELQIWAVQALPSGRFEPFAPSGGLSLGASADASADEAVWCEALEGAVRWTGTPGAFWNALLRARILMREGEGVRLTLCDRYVQVLEKRQKEAERKRRERAAKTSGAAEGRPADSAGTSAPKKKKDKESEKKSSSSAAAAGMGRLQPVTAPIVAVSEADASGEPLPVQRCLPGMHMVPASPPPEERLQAAVTAALGPQRVPEPETSRASADAFFESCQEERCRTLPGLPAEEQPRTWSGWYHFALEKVGGDESRLRAAWRGYLHSEWGRTREPRCTAQAFCSPRVWGRYLEPVHEQAPAASADESSESGRRWGECLAWLKDNGKRYALTWLAQARAVDVEDGTLVLAVPDAYFRQWVEDNYGALVQGLVRDFGLAGVRWTVADERLATGG